MAALTLTKKDITNYVKDYFVLFRNSLLDMLEKRMNIENVNIELNGEESIDIVLFNKDLSVEFNISINNLYEQLNENINLIDIAINGVVFGDSRKFYGALAAATLFCVSHKEEMVDDTPLYEQGAYDEIEDYDKKFDSLIADVVNPFRKAVETVVD